MSSTAQTPPTLSARLRRFSGEFLTDLGGPSATAERMHTIARARLLIGIPAVYLPAAIVLRDLLAQAADPVAMRPLTFGWLAMAACFVFVNAAALAVPAGRPGTAAYAAIRSLSMASIAVEMGANQALMYAYGTLLHPGVAVSVSMVAIYRIALDYRAGLFAAVVASAMYAALGVLEYVGGVPRHPAAPFPFVHPVYVDPVIVFAAIRTTVVSNFISFFAVNYGANQNLKLHRYITGSVLARYLPPALVAQAADGDLDLDGPPERRIVTVVFTDLVGFTRLSERLGPEAVGAVLNRYLGDVADLAHGHGATVDKFVGDAVMLVFGAPEPLTPAEQARRAVACARDIHAYVSAFEAQHSLEARTGINTGEAVVGNFGSRARSDYTVIGPAVNVAARLEAASRPGRILVGGLTAELLGDPGALEDAGLLRLKNVSEPVRAWFVPVEDGGIGAASGGSP